MDSESSKTQQRKSLATLFLLFLKISLTSFGGSSAAWVYREVVERRGWLDEKAYLTGLTIAQVLPGANPVNLSLYIGMQLRGGLGAVVAVLGIILPAFCVIMGIFYLYNLLGDFEATHAILAGVAMVGIGATMAIGAKLARHVMSKLVPALITIAIFFTVGVLRWPMVPVVIVAAPASILLALWMEKRRRDG